jgi:hypothetical protein
MGRNGLLREALVMILRPLARLLLRNGVSYKAFAEMAKSVFVEVARQEFRIPGRKQSDSRISVITGLSRKEVKRVQTEPLDADGEGPLRLHNRAARVIYGWTRDPDFLGSDGHPRPLTMDETLSPNFLELVRRYSGDAPPRAVLDELDRVHAVERHDDGSLSLSRADYDAPVQEPDEKLRFLGQVGERLLGSVDRHWGAGGHCHLMVEEGGLDEASLEAFRAYMREQGPEATRQFRAWLKAHASDGQGRRAGLLLVSYEG